MPRLTQRYGFPLRGYKFLEPSQLAPRGFIVGDDSLISHNFLIDPIDGKLMRRGGTAVVGTSTGVLETVVANATAKGLQIISLDSPSLTDGYPTHAVLFADEAKGYAWLYWRSTNSTGYDLNLGENFSSTNYSITSTTAFPLLRYVPLWFESLPPFTGAYGTGTFSAGALSRAANEITRRFLLSGSRRVLLVGSEVFWGGFSGTPARWDRLFNDTTTDAREEVIRPTGLIPPLFPPTLTTADISGVATTTAAAWKEGDQFYYSVAFINEAGEVSMPYIPSTATLAAPAGMFSNYYGLVTVPSSTANVDYYPYLLLNNLAIGPPGTRARLILRSPKVDSTLAGAAPDRLNLKVCGIIKNNVSTTFYDYRGNDLSLVDAPELVRLDRKWPDRARYLFPFDQRICAMFLKDPLSAIILAPTAVPGGTTRSYNLPVSVSPGSSWFVIRIIGSDLQLRYCNASPDATPVTTTISFSGTTLRSLVDAINATTTAGTGGEWAAQIVPGVDENVTCNNLRPTRLSGAWDTTINTPTLTGGTVTNGIAVGMQIHDSAGSIPAGTSVKSINYSTPSITMTANATATSAADTIDFADNTGDDDILNEATRTYGNIRAFCGANPVVMYLQRSFIETSAVVRYARVLDLSFTTGGPSDPPYAANSYVAGNRRSAPADAGIAMGGAPLLNGAVTYYSRAIGRLANIRGGKTGDDADYRNEIETWGRGCISPYSIVYGNGWTGALTDQGYEVRDSLGSRIISADLYNPSTGLGELAYEIGKCKAAANTIDGTDFQCYAHVESGKLYLVYRRSASNDTASHMVVYDFSASVEGAGLAQALRPDGTPWGWSAPLTYSWRSHSSTAGKLGAIGSVRKSDGTRIYTCDDSTSGNTECGLVQQIENGTWTDGGGSNYVTADGYLALDLHDTLESKSPVNLRLMYHTPGVAAQAKFFRSKNQANGLTIALPITTAPAGILRVPLSIAQRTACNQTQILLQAPSNSALTKVHFMGAELDVDVLPGLLASGG